MAKSFKYEEINYIINSYNNGLTLKQIGVKLNISPNPIRRILSENNVKIRGRLDHFIKIHGNIENEIIKDYLSGTECKNISKKFNLSTSCIRKFLRKQGILRTKSEAQKIAQNKPEIRLKKSVGQKLTMNRPEIKERNSKIQKDVQNRPDVKLRKSLGLSKAIKKCWKDPEYREKCVNSAKTDRNRPERKLQLILSAKERFKDKTKHPRYKGGITPLFNEIRNSDMYNNWRSSVFIRDNYTCQECGCYGGWLEAHHCNKKFVDILRENRISTIIQATLCYDLWNVNNGKTMCYRCHDKKDIHNNLSNTINPVLLLYP